MAVQYKTTGKQGLFDKDTILTKLEALGNPLSRILAVIDFELFRTLLETHCLNHDKQTEAGARPFDVVMLFKILILQRYYQLSEQQVEYQILDRHSFKAFLGLSSGDKVPDEKTVWAFKEKLTVNEVYVDLFLQFNSFLNAAHLFFKEGVLVDASFVLAPIQRNSREENQKIKAGEGDELWKDAPNKKSHKDIDARWTVKDGEAFYGYKNHAKVDAKSKLIEDYAVTPASVHDSQALDSLLDKSDAGRELYADSAYSGMPCKKILRKYKVKNKILKKGYKNKPLTKFQKKINKHRSAIRARVEHVFGFMEQSMKGLCVKTVGIARAKCAICLINLTYNLFRFEQIIRLNLFPEKTEHKTV